MFDFLMNNVEQLAAALDLQRQGDANNSRFSLILTDNAIEVALHQFALDRDWENREARRCSFGQNERHDAKKVKEALKQHFESKVKFAKELDYISPEVAKTILICHSYRNQLYHAGLGHERILPALAKFYLTVACELLGEYKPLVCGYTLGQPVSHRAQRYFGAQAKNVSLSQYKSACLDLKTEAEALPNNLIVILAEHMASVVEECDEGLDFLANDAPKKLTRDEVIVEHITWALAFSDEMRAYAEKKGCTAKQGETEYMKWLGANYKWKRTRDPILDWKKRSEELAKASNPHSALEKYDNFMEQEKDFLVGLRGAVRSLDNWIQQEIDIRRGK